MGGSNSKKEKINKIDVSQWLKINSYDGVDIVRSNRGRGEGQVRVIPLDPRLDLDKQLQIYQYRKNQDNAHVQCYGVDVLENKATSMCGKERSVKVLTERIPKRWSELPQLTFPETIYALNESLRGFDEIQKNAGNFQVTQDMIGINNNGNIKVWANENFAKNNPTFERLNLKTSAVYDDEVNTQEDMVKNVISVIEERCEEGRYPLQFRDRIYKNSKTFRQAEDELQRISKENNLFVPELIHPNTDIIVTKVLSSVSPFEESSSKNVPNQIPIEAITGQAIVKPTPTPQPKINYIPQLQQQNIVSLKAQNTPKLNSSLPYTYQKPMTPITTSIIKAESTVKPLSLEKTKIIIPQGAQTTRQFNSFKIQSPRISQNPINSSFIQNYTKPSIQPYTVRSSRRSNITFHYSNKNAFQSSEVKKQY